MLRGNLLADDNLRDFIKVIVALFTPSQRSSNLNGTFEYFLSEVSLPTAIP
jgi:hypothetical protein